MKALMTLIASILVIAYALKEMLGGDMTDFYLACFITAVWLAAKIINDKVGRKAKEEKEKNAGE